MKKDNVWELRNGRLWKTGVVTYGSLPVFPRWKRILFKLRLMKPGYQMWVKDDTVLHREEHRNISR